MPKPPPLPDTLENQLPCLSLRVIVRVTGGPDELTALCEIVGNLALEHAEWDSPGMFDKAGGVYVPAAPIVRREGMVFRVVFRDPRAAVAWLYDYSVKLPGLRFEYFDNEIEFQRTFTTTGQNGEFTQTAFGHYNRLYEKANRWVRNKHGWWTLDRKLVPASPSTQPTPA